MSDQATPTSVNTKERRKVQFFDGTSGTPITLVPTLVQDVITYTIEGKTVSEARHRGRHLANPIVVNGEDGNLTGSMSFLLATDLPTGTATTDQLLPMTWLVQERALAAGLVSTAPTSTSVGGTFCFGIRIYDEASNSTSTLRTVVAEKPAQSWVNDMLQIAFTFTSYQNDVTITSGDGTL